MTMASAITAHLPTPSLGGGFSALIEAVLSFVSRNRLTAEEREVVTKIKTIAENFGSYVLEATDREDILVRVDTLLEDPAYYRGFYGVFGLQPRMIKLPPPPSTEPASENGYQVVFGKVLGAATRPHLHELHRYMRAIIEYSHEYSQRMLAMIEQTGTDTLTEEDILTTFSEGADPLWFLSTPEVPIPVGQSMLAGLRCDVFALSACAAAFRNQSIKGWLGLALTECWVEQARQYLAWFASMPDMHVPNELVPPHMRFDLKALHESAKAVREAYVRFNADAERSGEPIYPSAS